MAVDDYALPNGTLKNKLGIEKQAELEQLEADSVAIRQAIISRRRFAHPYSLETLKEIHGFLFQDVYGWAGEIRSCSLAKRPFDDDSSRPVNFARPELVEKEAKLIFNWISANANLCGLYASEFASKIAWLFIAINSIHPFREGNGRTQRLLLMNVAANAGHNLAFDVITKERMIDVSVAGSLGDTAPAIRMFNEILDANRVRALRKAMRFIVGESPALWNDIYVATTVSGQIYNGYLAGAADPDFMMRVVEVEREWIVIGSADDLPIGAESGDQISVTAKKW